MERGPTVGKRDQRNGSQTEETPEIGGKMNFEHEIKYLEKLRKDYQGMFDNAHDDRATRKYAFHWIVFLTGLIRKCKGDMK